MPGAWARERLEQYNDRWWKLRCLADRVDLSRTTPAGWTAKEMLGHLSFWEETVVPVLFAMMRGGEVPSEWAFGSRYQPDEGQPWPVSDVHNAREAAWARSVPAAEVLARWDRAHAWMVWAVASINDDEVDERMRDYFMDKHRHYDMHWDELSSLV